jgi:hypothetical protein
MSLYWPHLERIVDEREGDPDALVEVLAELGFRSRSGAVRLRERVIDRLNELVDEGWPWPTTAAASGDGFIDGGEWPRAGMLSFLGYHVGENGLEADERRRILDRAYSGRLPKVNDAQYMQGWGELASSARLRKMAESIAAFCRNQRRRAPSALSVTDWESDLDYLHTRYYVGHYDFVWPDTALT